MADVQEAVRLGGEARRHPPAVDAGIGILPDDLPEEVDGFPWFGSLGTRGRAGHGGAHYTGTSKVDESGVVDAVREMRSI